MAGLVCMAVSLGVGARELGLFKTPLTVPLRYAQIDDTKFYLALIKGVVDHGWWIHNSSLGAPFGQQLYDFPQGADNLNLVLVRVLGLFDSNPAVIANLFLLLTFPLAAVSAFVVLRRLGLSYLASVMAAVIFSLLPYHFWRGESQLLLSAYYAVPLIAYLFVSLVGEKPLFRRDPLRPHWARTWLTGRTMGTVLCCLIIASTGLYYAAFALVLISGGVLVLALARRRLAAVVPGAAVGVLIAVVLGVNLAPSIVYRVEHGTNTRLTRTTADSEAFGLKLAGLLLPVRDHRVGFLSDLNSRYFDVPAPTYCEACYETLGTVGDVGFVWLGGLVLLSVVGVGGAARVLTVERRAALGVALSFLIATVGGLSGLIALFVTADVRGWNRMSLVIGFLSLLGAALLVDRARAWMRARGWPVWIGGVTVAGVLVAGILDETSHAFLPVRGPTRLEWDSDSTFTAQIESRMPHGAAIFQLPQMPFPEGYGEAPYGLEIYGGGFSTGYELMRGYLHSSTLRWSYGAMKGRPADWASELVTKPLSYAVDAAAVDGFDGLWLDLRGYDYSNRTPVKRELVQLTGMRPLLSPLRDLEFFDLRPLRRRLAANESASTVRELRTDSLYPVRTTCTRTGLQLENPSPVPRRATLSFTIFLPSSHPRTVFIQYPGQSLKKMKVGDKGLPVSRTIDLAPGTHQVTFSYAGAPQVPHAVTRGPQLFDPDLSDYALRALDPQPPGSAGPLAGRTPPPCVQTVTAVQSPIPS